jgi:hypothetical protein
LYTCGRSFIVLTASGAALLAGLLLIYLPVSRHPASLLTATILLLAFGLIYPEPALLAAQAAVLGLVLALVAGLLAYGVGLRHRRFEFGEAGSSVVVSKSPSTRSQPPASSPGSAATHTSPAAPPVPSEIEP